MFSNSVLSCHETQKQKLISLSEVIPDLHSSSLTTKKASKPENDTTPQRRPEQQRLASQPKTGNMSNVNNTTKAPVNANVTSEITNNQPSMVCLISLLQKWYKLHF